MLAAGYVVLYVLVLLARVPTYRRDRAAGARDAAAVVATTGRVIRIDRELSSETSESTGSPWYRPRVTYWGPAGEPLERSTQDRHKFSHWQVGTAIPVWVDPQEPARIWWRKPGPGDASRDLLLYGGIVTLAFVVGGVLLLAFGVL